MTASVHRVLPRRGRATGIAGVLLALVALVALAVRGVPVDATFDAQLGGVQGSLALTSVYAPSDLVATSTATDVGLTWAPGANGAGYTVLGAPADAGGQCTNAAWEVVGSTVDTAYAEDRAGPQGTDYCYMVETALGSWSSVDGNPTAVVPLGFVADSVTMVNRNRIGRLDQYDQFTVHFSRPVNPSTGPVSGNTVCATNAGTIVLGSTRTTGSCAANEANRLGTLTGGSQNQNVRFNATYAWTDVQTLVVTIGTRRSGTQGTTFSGTWTFNPTKTTSYLLSTTNPTHVCDIDAGGSQCLPVATGTL